MISISERDALLKKYRDAEVELDPEKKARKYLTALEVTKELEDSAGLDCELEWIANVRMANTRAILQSLHEPRKVTSDVFILYLKIILGLQHEMRLQISKDLAARSALEKLFGLHVPRHIVARFTQLALGEIAF